MNPTPNKKKWLAVTISAGILALLVTGAFLTYSYLIGAADGGNKYQFVFDKEKAPGWWAAANFWPTLDDYTGDQVTEKDLNVVGRTIFEGTGEQDMTGKCFVLFSYFDQPINIAQKLKEKEDSITFNDSALSLRKISTDTLTMETPEGVKTYELHNYDISGNNGSDFMRGTSVGYVALSEGYVFINSVCKEASQLQGATTALQAVKFAL